VLPEGVGSEHPADDARRGGERHRREREREREFAAGKTGTTENYGDAWFVGFTERLHRGGCGSGIRTA